MFTRLNNLQQKYSKTNSSYYSTLNKILIDVNFSLASNKDKKLIQEKILVILNVIQQTDPELKIFLLVTTNIHVTNSDQSIFTIDNIPVGPNRLAEYTRKTRIFTLFF